MCILVLLVLPMMISYQYLAPVGLPGTWCSVFLLRTDTSIQEASANTQENASCVSSVASLGLIDLANRANRTDISITNQNMNNMVGTDNGTFCTGDTSS